ncbi:MAG: virulence factor SrfB, partial [Muribaculaceae bacterium]|nr:virulence factor SrfB [Muribaculaceae bacterium]
AEASYFGQLLGIEPDNSDEEGDFKEHYKHIAYYAHFITFLRHLTGLKVRLYNPLMHGVEPVDVDLVLDIGNSKTCGILFESGHFTRRDMLALRDMTEPWKVYDKSFDMRVVFRQADFGDDIGLPDGEGLFKWRSLLRVGDEAIKLMHRSIEDQGQSKKSNNYSSPKRYLWDTDEYDGNWEYLHIESDPLSIRNVKTMYMDGLTHYLDADGSLTDKPDFLSRNGCHYSRSSLMTLAFLEIFRQAECQINSESFREKRGQVDRPRRLRNIIITAPTAMPNTEQVRLRRLARDAFSLMNKDGASRADVTVVPAPEDIRSCPPYAMTGSRDWCYDEATACQLVYIYAEVQERYGGDAAKFFNLMGKPRTDMEQKGFAGNVLTVGSIDIGAGTTDLMICSYGVNGLGRVTPVPLFWDSFYLAGDDIMRSIVQNLILEGGERGDVRYGTVSSVLQARLRTLTDEDFGKRLDENRFESHRIDLTNILRAASDDLRLEAIEKYGRDLMFDYFGGDTANNHDKDRRCRVDFNSQISIPLASYFLQLFSENRPQRDVTFAEVFGKMPPASYLLEHFRQHFGFPFEEIIWEYRPEKLAEEIRKIMTPLMEQLSLLLHAFNVDIVMLAGRPTALTALTDLFLKFYPVSPDRLIRLREYEVGNWYPFSHGTGEITDQKTIVAVGAYIGYLASHGGGIKGFHLDMSHLAKDMGATANYIGRYLPRTHRVNPTLLDPQTSMVKLRADGFPYVFGCKQLDTPAYEARPLYVLEWVGAGAPPMDMTLLITRSFIDDKERLEIEDAFDTEGRNHKDSLRLREQTLIDSETDDGNCWLDNGVFKFLKK